MSVDQFDEFGYAVFTDAVSWSAVRSLRTEANLIRDDLLGEMAARQTADPRVTWWRLATGQPYLLKIKPVVNSSPSAAAFASSDWVRGTVGQLLGATETLLMEDKFMYKEELAHDLEWAKLPVLGAEVCKHTDAAYFHARGFDRVVTVAVCLDDCTAEAGALKVWPGTHRRPVAMVQSAHQGPVVLDSDAPDGDAVTLAAPAGSVLAWDSALVHASGPNTSGGPRRLLVLGYTTPQSLRPQRTPPRERQG